MSETETDNEAPLNVFGVEVTIFSETGEGPESHVLTQLVCGPGCGAPLHRHMEREAFYVLGGEVHLVVEGETRVLRRGDFVQVESGQVHRFFNAGTEPARMVNLSLPAGHGSFFREADALFRSGEFTPERAMAVSAANGIEIIPE